MLNNFASISDLEIYVSAHSMFTVRGFHVTNALLTGLTSFVILFCIALYVSISVKRGRHNHFIGLFQWAFEGMLGQIYEAIPDPKLARKITPLALTIFFGMLAAYWMSVLPGLESISYNDGPVLRSMAADLNFTFAVTFIVFFVVQYYSVRRLGAIGSLRRYIRNPIKNPIGAFEGLFEFIGEFSRYMALSVRMFGNCFAGEILLIILSVMTGFMASLALPFFMAFELFIGFIQAYVFFILAVIFLALATESSTAHSNDHNITSTSFDHSSDNDSPKTVVAQAE